MNKSNPMGLHDVALERLKRISLPIVLVFIISVIGLVLASISFVRSSSAVGADGGIGIVIPVVPIFTPYKNAVFYSTAGSGTWVCPTGIFYIKAAIMGGGGGGGNANVPNPQSVSGGGSGAYAMSYFLTTPGTQYSYTVGAGGAGGVTGGTSTFDGMTATGGTGGSGPNAAGKTIGAVGGTAKGGQLNISGFSSQPELSLGSVILNENIGSAGANSPLGWGEGGSMLLLIPSSVAAIGYDAGGYGAGGGAACNGISQHSTAGGHGSGGFVMIEY